MAQTSVTPDIRIKTTLVIDTYFEKVIRVRRFLKIPAIPTRNGTNEVMNAKSNAELPIILIRL